MLVLIWHFMKNRLSMMLNSTNMVDGPTEMVGMTSPNFLVIMIKTMDTRLMNAETYNIITIRISSDHNCHSWQANKFIALLGSTLIGWSHMNSFTPWINGKSWEYNIIRGVRGHIWLDLSSFPRCFLWFQLEDSLSGANIYHFLECAISCLVLVSPLC